MSHTRLDQALPLSKHSWKEPSRRCGNCPSTTRSTYSWCASSNRPVSLTVCINANDGIKKTFMQFFILSVVVLLAMPMLGRAQERRKILISNATLSYSALPLVAARQWKLFQEQGLDVEIILMRSSAAAAALASGDLDYQSGIGPASVSATLSGVDSRALWSSTNKITYWLMAKPEFKTVHDLKRKKIGVSGLGGTSHVALNAALEKNGLGPKDYAAVYVPGGQLVQSLESGFVDAASLNPTTMFFAQRRGFHRLLD